MLISDIAPRFEMSRHRSIGYRYCLPYWLLAIGFALSASVALAQDQPAENEYQPRVGQAGKDVIWVPTAQTLIDKMLDIARVTPNDYVIDLGSGDGRTVISSAKRGAKALGIEYNPDMVELSKRNAAKEGVSERTSFIKADIYESDFADATVITMFLLDEINLKLRPKILDLKPGTRIVSNTFTMGAWLADQIVTADSDCEHYCVAHFWIVPAKVEGRWRLARGEINLTQSFQMVTGTLKTTPAQQRFATAGWKEVESISSPAMRSMSGASAAAKSRGCFVPPAATATGRRQPSRVHRFRRRGLPIFLAGWQIRIPNSGHLSFIRVCSVSFIYFAALKYATTFAGQ